MSATWKVLRWIDEPEKKGEPIPLVCGCGHEAGLPVGALDGGTLIAIVERNGMIWDPPEFEPPANWFPDEVQCPRCGCRLVTKIEEDV